MCIVRWNKSSIESESSNTVVHSSVSLFYFENNGCTWAWQVNCLHTMVSFVVVGGSLLQT